MQIFGAANGKRDNLTNCTFQLMGIPQSGYSGNEPSVHWITDSV